MPGTNGDIPQSVLENAFSESVRQAMRTEVQAILKLTHYLTMAQNL